MSEQTRQSGYYYVVLDGKETIAEYYSEYNNWGVVTRDYPFYDADFTHIGLPVPTQQELIAAKEIMNDMFKKSVFDTNVPEIPEPIPFDWEVYKMGGWQAVTRGGIETTEVKYYRSDEYDFFPVCYKISGYVNWLYVGIDGMSFSKQQSEYDLLMYKTKTDATTR